MIFMRVAVFEVARPTPSDSLPSLGEKGEESLVLGAPFH